MDAALAPLLDELRAAPRPTLRRRHRRSRRGPRRSRRSDARPVRVRIDAQDSADHRGARRRPYRDADGSVERARAARRPAADDARGGRGADARRDCRAARSCRHRSGGRGAPPRPSYFEAMSAMLNRGWAPLTGLLSGRDKYIDLPIPELYDLANDPGEATNLISSRTGHRAHARGRAARIRRRVARRARAGKRGSAARGCGRSATSPATRRARRSTPRPTTRSA